MPFLDNYGLSQYTTKIRNLLKGFVPVTRKINGKPLSSDLTLATEEIYSTEERVIGKWIDGKPLYRLTVEVMTPESTGYKNYYILSGKNIDSITRMDGTCRGSNGYYNTANSYIKESNPGGACGITLFANPAGTLAIHAYGGLVLNCPLTVTLEYTKTTDQATYTVLTSEISMNQTDASIAPTSASTASLY